MSETMIERFSWVRDRYNAEPRESGLCACGRHMTPGEYTYAGGSHGRYVCLDCGTTYAVDVNGVMWERTPEWIEVHPVIVPSRQADEALNRLEWAAKKVPSLRSDVAAVRAELERLRGIEDALFETARKFTLADDRARRLEDGLRRIEREGPNHEVRAFARVLLAGADEPDGGGA